MSGFRRFILRGNVVDLAVAVVIGAAFGAVVQAMVRDVITPIIGIFGGTGDVSALTLTIRGSVFPIGDLVNTMIYFVIIALVVYYFVVAPYGKLMERLSPAPT